MKRLLSIIPIILITFISVGCQKQDRKQGFTANQLKQIEQVSSNYLIKHPEILIKASAALQKQQMEKMQAKLTANVMLNRATLVNDKITPTSHPAKAKVAVIEFYDLNCAYCHKIAPEISALMQANPDVEFVFKEFPIFATRWQSSQYGAEMELALYQLGGFKTFIAYHNAIFNSGKMEGQLKVSDINDFAQKAAKANQVNFAKAKMLAKSFAKHIAANMQLGARDIGFQGTPGVIVMPLHGTDATKVTVFPGYTTQTQLQQAIDKAKA